MVVTTGTNPRARRICRPPTTTRRNVIRCAPTLLKTKVATSTGAGIEESQPWTITTDVPSTAPDEDVAERWIGTTDGAGGYPGCVRQDRRCGRKPHCRLLKLVDRLPNSGLVRRGRRSARPASNVVTESGNRNSQFRISPRSQYVTHDVRRLAQNCWKRSPRPCDSPSSWWW